MGTSPSILTPVSGQSSATVSFDTDTLIAACQGAAWKISGWMDHIAIHHAKGCACCHKYISHLLGAQSLGQINLLHSDIGNAVQSTWPRFVNSIEIDADEQVQGQISNLHAQINEMKDALHDAKKSLRNAEVALTKERSCIKDLEQEPFAGHSKCLSAATNDCGNSRTNNAGGCTHLVVPASVRGWALLYAPILTWDEALLPAWGG